MTGEVQFPLFADTPRARATDPRTSHEAAAAIKRSGALGRQQALVLALVRRFPGSTAGELAMYQSRADRAPFDGWRYRVSRRLPELAPAHIERGEARECKALGTRQTTWWPR